MCGITGFIDFNKNTAESTLKEMTLSLHHRGPDNHGTYLKELENCSVGLGHTRLSILDLSTNGHQPMKFNKWVIVFNGEVYNFKKIAKELSALGHTFESDSDTEVVLKSFHQWE